MEFLEDFRELIEKNIVEDLEWLEEEFKTLFGEHDLNDISKRNDLAKKILEWELKSAEKKWRKVGIG